MLLASESLSAQAYRYFLAQHEGNTTKLYDVTISGGNADLALITSVPYKSHIAYNESSREVLFVRESNANYQSYNLESSTLSPAVTIGVNGSFVAAAFSDGVNMTLGNGSNGKIYTIPVDFVTTSLTEIASAPVSGGDVVYVNSDLYLATRSGNRLMKQNGGSFNLLTNIPQKVTGMAKTEDGKLILSFFGSSKFRIYNTDGSFDSEVDVRLSGEPYVQQNGDFAAGAFEVPCAATQLISYNPTTLNDYLTPVSALRTIGTNALGLPENSDATVPETEVNFASLGFGGDITLGFDFPIKNGDGNDIKVFETTYAPSTGNCARYPEKIIAFASQDLCHWVYLGEGCQDTEFDLGPLTWAQYIKLVDITPANGGIFASQLGDGYDVDGIICLNGHEENPTPSSLVFGSATQAWLYQGPRQNGTPVSASRSDESKALGVPENTDAVNFVSLGFGGELILKFDYVIFDQAGNDIQIVETSYGNPACNAYPEKVMVEGSLDGITYFQITSEDICLDGMIDIAGFGPIQYIKLHDRSMSSIFSGSADGYDVDGVIVLSSCGEENPEAGRIADDITTPDEIGGAIAYPNPFSDAVQVEITTSSNDNFAQIDVVNFLGQQILSQNINVASNSKVIQTINTESLKKGVYFITIRTSSAKETLKVVKN
ncbi:MAG: T9SS type A sorting domain-containing protein [Bacteroidia bacterium]